jgi:hypothetical protein
MEAERAVDESWGTGIRVAAARMRTATARRGRLKPKRYQEFAVRALWPPRDGG